MVSIDQQLGAKRAGRLNPIIAFLLLYLGFLAIVLAMAWGYHSVGNIVGAYGVSGQSASFTLPAPLEGIGINLVGFVVPLLVSILAIVTFIARQRRMEMVFSVESFGRLGLFAVVLVSIIIFSIILRAYSLYGPIGTSDPLAVFVLSLFASVLVLRGNGSRAAYFAYPFGFLIGLASDVEATVFSSGTWGGYGAFDGDFFEPIALLIASLVTMWALNRLRRRKGSVVCSGDATDQRP